MEVSRYEMNLVIILIQPKIEIHNGILKETPQTMPKAKFPSPSITRPPIQK
jgi:hypothetical protein